MADADAHPPRKRARQACIACNARRVRCNVTEQRPCQNCILANVPCETRESRRGKHPRPSKRSRMVGVENDVDGDGDGDGDDDDSSPLDRLREPHREDEVAVSHVLASLHRNRQQTNGLDHRRSYTSAANGTNVVDATSDDSPLPDDPLKEDEGAVFLGESSSLGYVHEDARKGHRPKLVPQISMQMRHPVPNTVKAESLIPQWEAERRRARIQLLNTEGAFSLPPQHIVDELVRTYFREFHPCFAIVSEPEIWKDLRRGDLSPLLLQAMLFVGVIHCDEAILMELGLDNRHKAKYIFYNRVKDIYDADFETKKLTVIQALFLMSFWRAGALLEKDARHWLGAAVTLAESKALHRSTGGVNTAAAKLRKRLWWSMYTRERQCSAALGLPNRVRDDDCDIEPLERSDFENAFSPIIPTDEVERYISYAIGMADLAQLLGRIILGEYLPNRSLSPSQRMEMREDLRQWKSRLPQNMRSDDDLGQSGFHTNMLHLAYNNLLILLYRPGFINNNAEGQDVDGTVALSAAARNSTIIENMLAEGNLRHAQIHVITNLFNTLCVHTLHMRRSGGTARAVAEHRAKLCLLGLKELQRTWEVKNWLLKLFFRYLDRSTAARLRVERDDDSALPTAIASARTSLEPPDPLDALDLTRPLAPNQPPVHLGGNTRMFPDSFAAAMTPWSWSTEEANKFLFSQIENEFAFGEGGTLDWSPGDLEFEHAAYLQSGF